MPDALAVHFEDHAVLAAVDGGHDEVGYSSKEDADAGEEEQEHARGLELALRVEAVFKNVEAGIEEPDKPEAQPHRLPDGEEERRIPVH